MAKLISQERNGHKVERWWLHVGDDGREKITLETIEDVEPILENNKRLYNEKPVDHPVLGRRVASIPQTIMEELCRIHKISFAELMDKNNDRGQHIIQSVVNNPDLGKLRTAAGRVNLTKRSF